MDRADAVARQHDRRVARPAERDDEREAGHDQRSRWPLTKNVAHRAPFTSRRADCYIDGSTMRVFGLVERHAPGRDRTSARQRRKVRLAFSTDFLAGDSD